MILWVVILLAFSLIFIYLYRYRISEDRQAIKVSDEALRIHGMLTNRIYGCVLCGMQLFPGDTIYCCGDCEESYSYCESCYRIVSFDF